MTDAKHFNSLSPAEAERLALLLEEMGEAQQAIGKILRHGYESHNPFDTDETTNRQSLVRELGDVLAAIEIMCDAFDINVHDILRRRAEKKVSVREWLHHD